MFSYVLFCSSSCFVVVVVAASLCFFYSLIISSLLTSSFSLFLFSFSISIPFTALDYFFPETEGSDSSTGKYKAMLRLLKLPRLLRLGRLLKFLARFKYAGAMKIMVMFNYSNNFIDEFL